MEGTILVADDDRTIRTVLAQALTRAGCRVRATGTATTLWRWIEEGEGDVVVTDVMMPDGDALDLLPAIKKRRPDLPVIVMSAQNTVMTAIRAAEVGAYEYLPKPFDLKEVLGQVAKALNHKSRRPPPPEEEPPRARGQPAADRPLAGDAGGLPHPRAADEHRPRGDDHRRERHRQGAGRAGAAQLRAAQGRAVRRDQHGGDPARPDRERALRPREGRLHRRRPGDGRASSSRRAAARSSSTRSATCRSTPRPGCCACCRRASSPASAAARCRPPTCASSPRPTRTCGA